MLVRDHDYRQRRENRLLLQAVWRLLTPPERRRLAEALGLLVPLPPRRDLERQLSLF